MAKFDLDIHKGKKTEVCLGDKISSWIPCFQKGTFTDNLKAEGYRKIGIDFIGDDPITDI